MRNVFSHSATGTPGQSIRKKIVGPGRIAAPAWLACCVLCAGEVDSEARACRHCLADLQRLAPREVTCPVCAGPSPDPEHPCGHCQQRRPAFDRIFAAGTYAFPLNHLLHAAKFRGNVASLALLGDFMRQQVETWDRPQALLAMPLHRARLRERGYNQSTWLARACAEYSGIPLLDNGLARRRHTPYQSGLPRDARRRNIRDAFRAHHDLPDHVAVIDDVMTTGATLDEAARALKRSGVIRVDGWVALRAGW